MAGAGVVAGAAAGVTAGCCAPAGTGTGRHPGSHRVPVRGYFDPPISDVKGADLISQAQVTRGDPLIANAGNPPPSRTDAAEQFPAAVFAAGADGGRHLSWGAGIACFIGAFIVLLVMRIFGGGRD